MNLDDLQNKKILIAGLGVNNKQLARYFQSHGVKFELVADWESPDELVGKLDNCEIIFRTPGLSFLCKAIQQAKQRGAVIYSQTKLFFDLCPAPIIGVTGTKGKGTTATLIAKILEASGRKVWLSGNIGGDPFEFLAKIGPGDWVVLELSSFQLQDLHRSPRVAVVLKITPEHLDHHKSFEEYVDAKKSIVKYQSPPDFAILNYDNEVTRGFASLTPAQVFWNSTVQEVGPGSFVRDEQIFLDSASPAAIMKTSEVGLIGRFNLENVTAAVAAAAVTGASDPIAIKTAVAEFKGLPHRLEFVAEVKGAKFFDDSFSTTPETAMAALSAINSPVILIAGGSEKNSDFAELGRAIASAKVKALIPIGFVGPRIASSARDAGYSGRIVARDFKDMNAIVEEANSIAVAGDAVLLSPATASFDMFKNYKHRGELFQKFVKKL